MKRAKFFVTLATIATIIIGSTASVFAATLKITDKSYYDDKQNYLGVYPQVDGMDALNKKIYDKVWKQHFNVVNNSLTAVNNQFKVSYTTDDKDESEYAAVTVNVNLVNATITNLPKDFPEVYYINKTNKVEMTKEAYDKAVADEKAAKEAAAKPEEEVATEEEAAEESDEIIMIPLRAATANYGFTLAYDGATKTVTIKKDNLVTSVTVGVNEYTNAKGEKVELECEPINQDDYIYVPASFVTDILGGKLVIEADGNFTVSYE